MDVHRIDPSSPWRYECPKCESVVVHRMFDPTNAPKSFTAGGVGAQEAIEHKQHRYSCHECEWRGKRVYDKKAGGLRRP